MLLSKTKCLLNMGGLVFFADFKFKHIDNDEGYMLELMSGGVSNTILPSDTIHKRLVRIKNALTTILDKEVL